MIDTKIQWFYLEKNDIQTHERAFLPVKNPFKPRFQKLFSFKDSYVVHTFEKKKLQQKFSQHSNEFLFQASGHTFTNKVRTFVAQLFDC